MGWEGAAAERLVRQASGLVTIELAQEATLHTIAEISAAIVGFSLVGGILGSQTGARYRFFSVRDVAELGLLGLIASLAPSALHGFGLSPDVTWRIASGLFVALWIATSCIGISRYLRAGIAAETPRFLIVNPILAASGILLLLWGIFSGSAAGPRYVVALIFLLMTAGFAFLAAVFHRPDEGPAA